MSKLIDYQTKNLPMKLQIRGVLTLSFVFISTCIYSQTTYYSKEWSSSTNNNSPLNYTTSVKSSDNSFVTATSILSFTGNSDLRIKKMNADGQPVFDQILDGSGNLDDYPAKVIADGANNVYVLSAKNGSNFQNFDIGVTKLDGTGTIDFDIELSTSNGYNSAIPVDLAISDSGNLYLVASVIDTNGFSDIALYKFNSSGSMQWVSYYDYNNLNDAPSGITFLNGFVIVSGVSQTTSSAWDYVSAGYSRSTGNFYSEERTSNTGIVISSAVDVAQDADGNTYILGSSDSLGSQKIKLLKIDTSLSLQWISTISYRTKNEPTAIEVSNPGNVYISGTCINTSDTDMVLVKIDPTTGATQWESFYEGDQDSKSYGIVANYNGDLFHYGIKTQNNSLSRMLLKYNAVNGEMLSETSLEEENLSANIEVLNEDDTLYIISLQTDTSGNSSITSTKLVPYVKEYVTYADTANNLYWNENELIIRFDTSALIGTPFLTSEVEAGSIADFVKASVIQEMTNKTGIPINESRVFKVFRKLTPADSVSTSRLGNPVKLPTLWATLSVMLPEPEARNAYDLMALGDSLTHLSGIVYAEPNYFSFLESLPNDPQLLTQQASLVPYSPYLNANINVSDAWNIETGENYVKVGVFDKPVYYQHEDFSNSSASGNAVKGGWDYVHGISAFNASPSFYHGTSVAGIIGAVSNNNTGIAGIAGGDDYNGHEGVAIYSSGVSRNGYPNTYYISDEDIANAMVEGAVEANGYGYGMHIQNHSYSTGSKSQLVKNATRVVASQACIFVASRGNHGSTTKVYPACFEDFAVLNTGASNSNGEYKNKTNSNDWASAYGGDLDFIAPGVANIVRTLDIDNTSDYRDFYGTSAAAPHVSGAAALLYSMHHINKGYSNNLTGEDIEHILQENAMDKNILGYDDKTGYGLINAYASLMAVKMPQYQVRHFHGSPVSTSTTVTPYTMTYELTEPTNDLSKGTFIQCTQKKVIHNFQVTLPSNELVKDLWIRVGQSNIGFPAATTHNADYAYTLNNVAINGNTATFSVETYVYYLFARNNYDPVLEWAPFAAEDIDIAYSVLAESIYGGSEDHTPGKTHPVNVFPNPAHDALTVTFTHLNAPYRLEVWNSVGALVTARSILPGESTMQLYTHYMTTGYYFIKIYSQDAIHTKKFIKQ
ncbi:MAG: hypothetical protein CL843_01420 [Crocinitomicaceae bacterium]|nr:hypothetical protein [Crocinitomicaceae bacterium]